MWALAEGHKVVLPYEGDQPSGTQATGLLGNYLGVLARESSSLPIGFKSWPTMPMHYKDAVYNNSVKVYHLTSVLKFILFLTMKFDMILLFPSLLTLSFNVL